MRAGADAPAGRTVRQPGPENFRGELWQNPIQDAAHWGTEFISGTGGDKFRTIGMPRLTGIPPQQSFVRNNWREVSRRWSQITENQRLSWRVAAKEQWSRRRLGKRYPLKGYYYYMRINVALANRGQPLLDLPPGDPPPAGLSQPLLTSVWHDQPEKLLTLCAPAEVSGPGPVAAAKRLSAARFLI